MDYYANSTELSLHSVWLYVVNTPSPSPNSGCPIGRELKPNEAQRFAWDDPAGVRKLSWNCLEHSGELDLVKVTLTHATILNGEET